MTSWIPAIHKNLLQACLSITINTSNAASADGSYTARVSFRFVFRSPAPKTSCAVDCARKDWPMHRQTCLKHTEARSLSLFTDSSVDVLVQMQS